MIMIDLEPFINNNLIQIEQGFDEKGMGPKLILKFCDGSTQDINAHHIEWDFYMDHLENDIIKATKDFIKKSRCQKIERLIDDE
jgi:hypothetical protein